jgi:hypothetical protein
MECLIGGIFLAVFVFGFILWLGSAISAAQTQGQPAPAPARQKSEYGGSTRTVKSTPRQRETAAKVKASDQAITTARRQALKGTPKGTVHYERIKPVSYEGKTVNAMCLNDQGEITGYVDLADMPLPFE